MIQESTIWSANPWWKDPLRIRDDQKIKDWEESATRYEPGLLRAIRYDFAPSNTVVYSLRGPRQVGKTTLVKLQIREFLDRGVCPWNIFYYTLDLAGTAQDLVGLIERYMKTSSGLRGENRCYLFLDEISSVSGWQKGIKWLYDSGSLQNCTVVVTGSHSVDIRNAAERLPGRRGEVSDNHDKILLPMKFSEYASMRNDGIRDALKKHLSSVQDRRAVFKRLLSKEIDDRIYWVGAHQDELDGLLREYMITGGMPKTVNEKIRTGGISEGLYKTYLDSIVGQWSALGKNESKLKQFCMAAIKSQGSHTSWNSLSKEADIGSGDTASDYAYTLKDMFVLSAIHRYGDDKRIPMIKSDKKLYFRDPYFLHVFNGLASAKDSFGASLDYVDQEDNQGRIVEGVTADHLIRWAFALSNKKQTFDYYNHVFYWKDKSNREVDFVLYGVDDIEVPIEVKYRKRINFRELSGLASFLGSSPGTKSGLVVSRYDLEVRSEYVVIPAAVFLLLM